jgi:hypothetical protein
MIMRRIALVLPLLLLPAFGCSGGKGATSSVSGKIMLNGQTPVTAGTVTFYPAEGAPVEKGINSDGTYIITDIPAGEYTVTVETESVKRAENAPVYGGGRGGAEKGQEKQGRGGMSPAPPDFQGGTGHYVKIPEKYGKKESTPLKTTIGKGKNTYDIPLSE